MLIGITDRSLYETEAIYLEKIDSFLRSSIDYLIVRDKDLSRNEYDILIRRILENNEEFKSKLIIHTHMDVAKSYGINNVHLPEAMIGINIDSAVNASYSLHPTNADIDEIVAGSFFVLISPVYETTCKPGSKPMSKRMLNELKDKFNQKIVLLGGLDKCRIKHLEDEGFLHFAVRSGLDDIVYCMIENK